MASASGRWRRMKPSTLSRIVRSLALESSREAVLSSNEPHLLGSLLLKTASRDDSSARLRTIRDKVDGFMRLHRPDALAIEGQFFHHQRSSAFKVGQAFGVVL